MVDTTVTLEKLETPWNLMEHTKNPRTPWSNNVIQFLFKQALGLGGGGYFPVKDYWGCATGWGHIFTTGLTIMGLHF